MRHLNRFVRPLIAMLITGGVMTSSATFAADKGDKPAAVQTVKDGLSVSVAPAREVFAADENPAFTVTFTNLRDSALRLGPGIAMVDVWTITAEEVTTGATYTVHSTVQYRRRVLTITTLAAKETKTAQLDFGKFQFIPIRDGKTADPISRLPAGKYRMTIAMKFDVVFDTPESAKPPAWIGEIKTDAVLFEIAAK